MMAMTARTPDEDEHDYVDGIDGDIRDDADGLRNRPRSCGQVRRSPGRARERALEQELGRYDWVGSTALTSTPTAPATPGASSSGGCAPSAWT